MGGVQYKCVLKSQQMLMEYKSEVNKYRMGGHKTLMEYKSLREVNAMWVLRDADAAGVLSGADAK